MMGGCGAIIIGAYITILLLHCIGYRQLVDRRLVGKGSLLTMMTRIHFIGEVEFGSSSIFQCLFILQ